jgi:hypothetical protein
MLEKEEKALPESVTLSNGVVATKKRATVRDLANAGNQPKGKEYLTTYAQFATKVQFNGKNVVLEDILDLYDDDLELLSSLFIDEDELKNV